MMEAWGLNCVFSDNSRCDETRDRMLNHGDSVYKNDGI